MNNLAIREFSQAIISFVNKSELPIEVKRLVLSDILTQIDAAANSAVQTEIIERNVAEQKETEEKDHGTEQAVQQN